MQRFSPAGEDGGSFQEAFFILAKFEEIISMSTVLHDKDDVPLRSTKPP
jgi:hypothetical protein